ncbi:MAG: hypothetical protein OEZ32_02110 [Nitrospinota bacterium]|nr:hypothetical protein [Nitrospinota bacterium]
MIDLEVWLAVFPGSFVRNVILLLLSTSAYNAALLARQTIASDSQWPGSMRLTTASGRELTVILIFLATLRKQEYQ